MLIQVFASMYRCCCCFDLRTGSIIIAILHIVVSLGMLSFGLSEYRDFNIWTSIYRNIGTAIRLSILLDCVAGVAAGICLLIGEIKSNASAILVYLILAGINFFIRCVIGLLIFGPIVAFGFFYRDRNSRGFQFNEGHVIVISIIGILIAVMALSIYFWVCVYRFYLLTKYGKVTSCA